ncbi:MAG: sulfatase [Acidobacteria bacterium]|jgi:hypothetical protein|nr:sulfatase [Acidobacteriota bacterium]
MKKYGWLLLLLPLLLSGGCSKAPSRDLPPTLLWHKDQNMIRPADGTMNVWEGFRIDEDAFTAERDFSQFIFWRAREQQVTLAIDYTLAGRKVDVVVNAKKRNTLAPSSAFKRAEFKAWLGRGMNFLQFNKKKSDKLRVRSIAIGQAPQEKRPQLRSGEGFSRYHPQGRGRLVLQGRGRIEIREQRTAGGSLQTATRQLKSRWLSRRIAHEIVFAAPGMLTVTVLEGSFAIGSYAYEAAPPSPPPPPGIRPQARPNIYLILSDACQASHLGTYGYARDTSPHVDAFARDAVVYENAYANSVFTRPSVATIFTGFYPDKHKVRLVFASLPQNMLTLPEYLDAKGYATSIFSSNVVTSPRCGFTQGVDDFHWISSRFDAPKDISIYSEFIRWLEKAAPPHFSFMHYIHPHFPKVPPDGFPVSFRPGKTRTSLGRMNELTRKGSRNIKRISADELQEITDTYDSSIAWVDSEFGRILANLKAKGLYDDSLIIFLADHGEAQGEHGVLGHGRNVYDETTRVPLVVKYPKSMNLRGRVRPLVELADIFPTIAWFFGQDLALDGRNLLLAGLDDDLDDRMVVSRTGIQPATYGLRWRDWYYMHQPGRNFEKLFLLTADAYREADHPQMRAFLKSRFLDWFSRFRNLNETAGEISLKDLPASDIEEMKTLGYL